MLRVVDLDPKCSAFLIGQISITQLYKIYFQSERLSAWATRHRGLSRCHDLSSSALQLFARMHSRTAGWVINQLQLQKTRDWINEPWTRPCHDSGPFGRWTTGIWKCGSGILEGWENDYLTTVNCLSWSEERIIIIIVVLYICYIEQRILVFNTLSLFILHYLSLIC
jgi:hypothetical protein